MSTLQIILGAVALVLLAIFFVRLSKPGGGFSWTLLAAWVLVVVAAFFSDKPDQPNAMQALAERGDTTAIQGPFENGSTVPVLHPVKVIDRENIDPLGRLNWCKVLYEVYPYTDPPAYEFQTSYAIAGNDGWYRRDSLAYAFSRTMHSKANGVEQIEFLVDVSVGRHMLMQKQAVVYGEQHKQSGEPY